MSLVLTKAVHKDYACMTAGNWAAAVHKDYACMTAGYWTAALRVVRYVCSARVCMGGCVRRVSYGEGTDWCNDTEKCTKHLIDTPTAQSLIASHWFFHTRI